MAENVGDSSARPDLDLEGDLETTPIDETDATITEQEMAEAEAGCGQAGVAIPVAGKGHPAGIPGGPGHPGGHPAGVSTGGHPVGIQMGGGDRQRKERNQEPQCLHESILAKNWKAGNPFRRSCPMFITPLLIRFNSGVFENFSEGRQGRRDLVRFR